jgi:hypothetical protein
VVAVVVVVVVFNFSLAAGKVVFSQFITAACAARTPASRNVRR